MAMLRMTLLTLVVATMQSTQGGTVESRERRSVELLGEIVGSIFNLVGVAAESLDEFTTKKKKNIAPIVETVIDIKNTLTDTPFAKSVARTGLQTARVLPDIIGNTAVVVSDLIKLKLSLLKSLSGLISRHKSARMKTQSSGEALP
eukprot:TRINITY_DN35782_c0_g1_i1.p1 TRINITY_DN35782_c0_g1~~TRINITY_DN35782_c0_g1_i1.p1  ORF type:complete len:146 (-),score=47.81 TRINITY_DN35782_c0_g1_i1:68-505(-)